MSNLAETAALVLFGRYVGGLLTDTSVAQTLRYLVFKRELTKGDFTKYHRSTFDIDESVPRWWEPIEQDYDLFKRLQSARLFWVERRLVPTTGHRARRDLKKANFVVWNTTTASDIAAAIPKEHHNEVLALMERKMLEGDVEGDYWLKAMGLR